jgi:hypothetical protein
MQKPALTSAVCLVYEHTEENLVLSIEISNMAQITKATLLLQQIIQTLLSIRKLDADV